MVSETCRSTITSDAFFVTTNQGDETIDHIPNPANFGGSSSRSLEDQTCSRLCRDHSSLGGATIYRKKINKKNVPRMGFDTIVTLTA